MSKDSVEVAAPTESRALNKPNSQRKATSTHARADAVSLDVAVKVHGSRPASASSGASPQTERFEEQTSTMIVFAKGGVLRMTTPVTSGQMLVVTNLKSRQDAICRVVNVRSFPNMPSYVEVEFTQPQPGYWGVHFSSETASAAQGSSSKPSMAQEKETSLDRPPEASELPAALRKTLSPRPAVQTPEPSAKPVPAPPSSYARPGSPFVAIGTTEEVQPAAAATSIAHPRRTGPELEESPKNDLRKRSVLDTSTEEASSENRLVTRSSDAPDVEEIDRAIRALGGHGSGSTVASDRPAAPELFGTRLGREAEQITSPAGHRNWVLVATCAGLALAAVAGGVWYFRHSAATVTTGQGLEAKPAPAAVQPAAEPSPTPPVVQPEQTASPLTRPPSPVESSEPLAQKTEVVSSTKGKPKEEPRTQRESHIASDDRTAQPKGEEASPAKAPAPSSAQPSDPTPGPALAPQANAHPLWSEHAVDTAQVPSVEGSAQTGPGELPGVGSGVALPPPPGDTPVHVGGKIREPQLISNPMPAYPDLAKQAHVEGDVVIETEIDKTGSVAGMRVLSGPIALRSAALDALRRWKYKPSQLDGQPVAVQMLVTIKFRL
ncbi:MAG TPA: TonB family protein [Candidatus Cybelea sp.]|nr:TonB family protein [Candidatus Cybelea sp.]